MTSNDGKQRSYEVPFPLLPAERMMAENAASAAKKAFPAVPSFVLPLSILRFFAPLGKRLGPAVWEDFSTDSLQSRASVIPCKEIADYGIPDLYLRVTIMYPDAERVVSLWRVRLAIGIPNGRRYGAGRPRLWDTKPEGVTWPPDGLSSGLRARIGRYSLCPKSTSRILHTIGGKP